MKRRWLPDNVTTFNDRHGKPRYRYRRKGFTTYYFKSLPGTEEFMAEYRACQAGVAAPPRQIGADRARPGTFDDLLIRYYGSPDFLDPAPATSANYRRILEHWRVRSRKGVRYGEIMVRDLQARHVELMVSELLPRRTAANMLRKRLFAVMRFAVRSGYAKSNPVTSTKPFKVNGGGYHTWNEDEIARYEECHALGTTARLALDLMLWTGQRGGDARLMGASNVIRGRMELTQEKTGVFVSVPILAPLAESIIASRVKGSPFLRTEYGKPFSKAGFGNRMRKWCDEADLKHCTAHGLRKAASRRFAEAGCTNQEIKAWTGHTTDSEVARYTADASRRSMSDAAGAKLLANLAETLANETAK